MIELGFLAVALAMDAFAVAIVRGCVGRATWSQCVALGLMFGAAQGLMPLVGWGLGVAFRDLIASWDHWLAFGLLAFLGLRMIREGFQATEESFGAGALGLAALFASAVATSIDAAAAGLTLDTFGLPVALACLVIAGVTATLSFTGCAAGCRLGPLAGKRAELLGGLVLILLGANLLHEHLTA